MALTAAGSALVAGSSMEKSMEKSMQIQHVKVVRAFYFNKELWPVGKEDDMPKNFALDMRASNKVEFIEPKPQKNIDLKQPTQDNAKAQDAGSKTKTDANNK